MVQQIQNDPIVQMPLLNIYGLIPSRASETTLQISAGQCKDASNNIDMGIGSAFPPVSQRSAVSAPITLNAAVNGANGLDASSLAASKMYAIYLIGDSTYRKNVASLLSLASNSVPTMPLGYDSYRIIGYWATNGSSQFILGYYQGVGNNRQFIYDAPVATAITAGNATTYTAIDLSAIVPPVNNTLTNVLTVLTPNAATSITALQGAASTGDSISVKAQVASVPLYSYNNVMAQLASGAPKINYKTSSASDSVAVSVVGFMASV